MRTVVRHRDAFDAAVSLDIYNRHIHRHGSLACDICVIGACPSIIDVDVGQRVGSEVGGHWCSSSTGLFQCLAVDFVPQRLNSFVLFAGIK